MSQATESKISTMETQELIYKRRIQRLNVTKGIDRGTLIDRVNAISGQKALRQKERVNSLRRKHPSSFS